MTREFSETSDIINSRDVIARIEELRYMLGPESVAGEYERDLFRSELEDLEELASQGEGAADWFHGETLIRDDYFEEYARDLAEDIGAIDRDAAWPLSYIDWEAAAEALRMDYFSVEFRGVTYWIR